MQIATDADHRRIADRAQCDRRTVAKFLRGEPVRRLAAHRIALAMLDLGLGRPAPATTSAPSAS